MTDQDQLVFIKADNAPNWSRVQSTQIFSGVTESALEHNIPKNRVKGDLEVPGSTDLAKAMSKDMKKRGFRFVGPTVCYAFMQAVGMVNDHTTDCFRHKEIKKMAREGNRP